MQTGRDLQVKRYGGRDPVAFLKKARPEEEGEPVRSFTDRQGRTREVDGSERVQFFTDENGVVHPIRASYEHKPRTALPSSYLNAYGQTVQRRQVEEDDEAF